MRLNHAVRSPDSRKRLVNSSWKNSMKRIVLIAGLTVLSLGILRADDDALLRLLVRKGIITEQEASEVKNELAQEKSTSPAKGAARAGESNAQPAPGR
jgi:hypothetical protein